MRLPVLTLVVYLTAASVHAKYSGGTGEPNDPYQIATAADLMLLGDTRDDYDKQFILTADIDLDPNLPGGRVFDRAIITYAFTGDFDGAGHSVKHLTIDCARGASLGLFCAMGAGGQVRNLAMEEVSITSRAGRWMASMAGALVGANQGLIDHCRSTGTVSITESVGGRLGGLVGENSRDPRGGTGGTISRCSSSCTVTSNYYTMGLGGLVGENRDGQIESCYARGTIKGSVAGGLVGTNCGRITDCYASSSFVGEGLGGGLVAVNWGTVTRCFSIGRLPGRRPRVMGGLIGSSGAADLPEGFKEGVGMGWTVQCFWDVETSGTLISSAGLGLTTAKMMDPKVYSLNGWAGDPNWVLDGGRDYPHLSWEGSPGQPIPEPVIDWFEGNGTIASPYRIAGAQQMASIGTASVLWASHFILEADLDLRGVELTGIGLDERNGFTGGFDGEGHVIRNLSMTAGPTAAPHGLFGCISHGGKVRRLGIENAMIQAAPHSNSVGALAGLIIEATVDECHTTGSLSGGQQSQWLGGLVGRSLGSTIQHCWSSVRVSADKDSCGVGGLVGYHHWAPYRGTVPPTSGIVTQCYATGDVAADGNCASLGGLIGDASDRVAVCSASGHVSGGDASRLMGGLAGYCVSRSVVDCYASGEVSAGDGSSHIGGLAGIVGGVVARCYARGRVSAGKGSESIGGFTGSVYRAQVTGCFWDMESSGISHSEAGTGLTTAQMQDPREFVNAGWDLAGEQANGMADLWTVPQKGQYPVLNGLTSPHLSSQTAGAGTPDDPYRIVSVQDLAEARYRDRSACYRLTADIDLASANGTTTPFPQFDGRLDGADHAILHLTIRQEQDVGLFGDLGVHAVVENLRIQDATIVGGKEGHRLGVLAAKNEGTVVNCHVTGNLSGDSDLGGLAGANAGMISRCSVAVHVAGRASLGGIAGSNSGTIAECSASGSVAGNGFGSDLGGLVGSNTGTISRCGSTTTLSDGKWSHNVGGLAGRNEGSITDCYATGSVSGGEGTSYLGGLVGWNRGTVTHCYAAGSISGGTEAYVGGLVGRKLGNAMNSFWDAATSGIHGSAEGGGVGLTTAQMREECSFAGWDFEKVWTIDEGRDYPRLRWEK